MALDQSATDDHVKADESATPSPAESDRNSGETGAHRDLAAAMSESLAFWFDEAEDIYGPEDGEPL
ncbi:MAG: hypothetical protein AAF532_08400 [Planctomycetota bacterium]